MSSSLQIRPKKVASAVTHGTVSAPDGSAAHVDPMALHVAVQFPPDSDISHSRPELAHQASTGGGGITGRGGCDGGAGDGASPGGNGGSRGSGGGAGTGWHGQKRREPDPTALQSNELGWWP